MAQKLQLWYVGLGGKARSMLAELLNAPGINAVKGSQSPQTGSWPFELSRQCWDSCKVENCTK